MNILQSRRKFLLSLVISIGAPSILTACQREDYLSLAANLSATPLARPDLALKVGKAYVKYIEPDKQLDIVKIVDKLLNGLALSTGQLRALDQTELISQLQAKVRRDFETENVLEVVGWILSSTETKLCLLAYLLKTQSGEA